MTINGADRCPNGICDNPNNVFCHCTKLLLKEGRKKRKRIVRQIENHKRFLPEYSSEEINKAIQDDV